MEISVPTLHQQLTDLWEAEWSGENLSDSALAQKFIDYVEGFEFELRESIAREITAEICIELHTPNSNWADGCFSQRGAFLKAANIAKGK